MVAYDWDPSGVGGGGDGWMWGCGRVTWDVWLALRGRQNRCRDLWRQSAIGYELVLRVQYLNKAWVYTLG